MLVTEHEFTLPNGFIDRNGNLHRDGVMRLATAADEIVPMRDPRVQSNPAYLVIVLLARVVTRLGKLAAVDTAIIENLFAGDLAFLQSLYNRINHPEETRTGVTCPHCKQGFELEPAGPGGF